MGFLTGFATGAFGAISEGLDNIAEEEKKRAEEERALERAIAAEGRLVDRTIASEGRAEKRAIAAAKAERLMRESLAKIRKEGVIESAQITAGRMKKTAAATQQRHEENKEALYNSRYKTILKPKDGERVSYEQNDNPARQFNNFKATLNSLNEQQLDAIMEDPKALNAIAREWSNGADIWRKDKDVGQGYVPSGEQGMGKVVTMTPGPQIFLDASVFSNPTLRKHPLYKRIITGLVNGEQIKDLGIRKNTVVVTPEGNVNTAQPKYSKAMMNWARGHQQANQDLHLNDNENTLHSVLRGAIKRGLPTYNENSKKYYNVPVGFREYVKTGEDPSGSMTRWLSDNDPNGKHLGGWVKKDSQGRVVGLSDEGIKLFRIYSPDNAQKIKADYKTHPNAKYLDRNLSFSSWRKTTSDGKVFDKQLIETKSMNRQLTETSGLLKILRRLHVDNPNIAMTSLGKGIVKSVSYLGTAINDVKSIFGRSDAYEAAISKRRIIDFEGKDSAYASTLVQSKLSKFLTDVSSSASVVDRKEALEYLLAYQLTSIFQGGSGGRTISDADVRIYMKIIGTSYTGKDAYIGKLDMISEILKYKRADTELLSKLIPSNLQSTINADVYQSYKSALEFNRKIRNETGNGIGDLVGSKGAILDESKFNSVFSQRKPSAVTIDAIHNFQAEVKGISDTENIANKLAQHNPNVQYKKYRSSLNTLVDSLGGERAILGSDSKDNAQGTNLDLEYIVVLPQVKRMGYAYDNLGEKTDEVIKTLDRGISVVDVNTGNLVTRYVIPEDYQVGQEVKYKMPKSTEGMPFKLVHRDMYNEFKKDVILPQFKTSGELSDRTKSYMRAYGGLIPPTRKLFTLSQEK